MAFKDFKIKVEALSEKKWNFVRATYLYQQALKCGKCNPNVGILLLCSSADAMQLVGNRKPRENFEKFYKDYCPSDLRNPPIQYYLGLEPPLILKDASFEESLDYIYASFRCLFTHEGIGRLETTPKNAINGGWKSYDKFKNKYYSIDILNVFNWFTSITKGSLSRIII
jgi:hypothetical protein